MSNTKDVYTPATAGADPQRDELNGGLDDPKANHAEEGVAGPSKKPKKSLKDVETWKAGAKKTWKFVKPALKALAPVVALYKLINDGDDDNPDAE
ncbi:hypothetical protein FRB90_010258 [Tulasnella sp. 427]|nr:hypothetical protein FRB90_010258 [Tulasnella sp. 427]